MLAAFAAADRLRGWQGWVMDSIGLGPIESPWQIDTQSPTARLRRYQGDGTGRPILIVPAPIKRPYLWDLRPDVSVIRRCLATGCRVYLVEWLEAKEASLADLVQCLRHFVEWVGRETGQAPVLAGHSLGGTLATIAVARCRSPVAGLILLEAPLHFGADCGRLVDAARAAAPAGLPSVTGGLLPGTVLDWLAVAAAPDVFIVGRALDWLRCLGDGDAMLRHLLVSRWILDEWPFPAMLFAEVVNSLYRDDLLYRGRLLVAEQLLGPAEVVVPLLIVTDPDSPLVPPAAVLPFVRLAASPDRTVWWYRPAVGAGVPHVGVLVDRTALRQLWPSICRWISRRTG